MRSLKNPHPYCACKALSWWSGLCCLSSCCLLPLCTFSNARCPLPSTAFALAAPSLGLLPLPSSPQPCSSSGKPSSTAWPTTALLQGLHHPGLSLESLLHFPVRVGTSSLLAGHQIFHTRHVRSLHKEFFASALALF